MTGLESREDDFCDSAKYKALIVRMGLRMIRLDVRKGRGWVTLLRYVWKLKKLTLLICKLLFLLFEQGFAHDDRIMRLHQSPYMNALIVPLTG